MEQPRRTLVAVVNGDAGVHTLYFSDGTVVGYEPDRGRVTRVHQLPADFGPAEAVMGARHTAAIPLLGTLAQPDRRRRDEVTPVRGGHRADDLEAERP
jgi:hypothetical protein